jgi:hypothetical protein
VRNSKRSWLDGQISALKTGSIRLDAGTHVALYFASRSASIKYLRITINVRQARCDGGSASLAIATPR